jgi:hypothetical protein
MKDLNNPKLTNQEKEHIIRCSTDKEYQKEVDEQEKNGRFYAPHMWIVCPKQLAYLNRAAKTIDTWFDFLEDGIYGFHPETHILMIEGERVLEGEWDKTYERWSSHSYQRVYCVALNAKIEEFNEKGCFVNTPSGEEDAETNYQLYPSTFDKSGKNIGVFHMGIVDVPLDAMNSIEDCRQKNLFGGLKYYEEYKEEIKQEKLRSYNRKKFIKGIKCDKSRKSKKQLKKGFKGGFI